MLAAAKKIFCGPEATIVETDTGFFGMGHKSRIGLGNYAAATPSPLPAVKTPTRLTNSTVFTTAQVITVSIGYDASFALTFNGAVYTWGTGISGNALAANVAYEYPTLVASQAVTGFSVSLVFAGGSDPAQQKSFYERSADRSITAHG